MRPLSLANFNRLPNSERYELLEDHGHYLDLFYLCGSQKICLFALFGYYVEVYYHQSNDKLLGAVAFDQYSRLDPFLAGIDLKPIYASL